jgi:hypothetical protein
MFCIWGGVRKIVNHYRASENRSNVIEEQRMFARLVEMPLLAFYSTIKEKW